MATEPEPVSSHPSTALEQVEKESIENAKTIEKKPIADDESPGLDVISSGPEETTDDHVAELDKGNVSGGTDGDGIKSEAVNKDLEKLEKETNRTELVESEADVTIAKLELAKEISEINIEPFKPLNNVAKEEVQVKDSPENIDVLESVHKVSNVEFEQSEPLIPKETVGQNEDLSEEKAQVIGELEKESAEHEAADKIEADAAKDKESRTDEIEGIELKSESELEPIGIENPKQDGITSEEAHVEQKDRDFPLEADEKLDTESSRTEKLAVNEDNEVNKEDTVVNEESAKGINDVVAETEHISREIELPADLEGDKDETLATADKDIEVEKKVDAEEPYKSETGSKGEDLSEDIADELKEPVGAEAAKKIDVDSAKDEDMTEKVATECSKQVNTNSEEAKAEAKQKVTEVPTSEAAENIDAKDPVDVETEDKEENVVVNDESDVPEANGIKEETNKTELPESETEVNEAKGEVAKGNLREIEPSESLDDAAKKSSEKFEIPELVPEASNVELEQSEAVIPKEVQVTEAKDVGYSAAKEVKNEDLSDEKEEITKEVEEELAETDAADRIEVDAAKDKESQADKVEGFELKSEAELEPTIATEESNVEQNDTDIPPEAAENIDTEKLGVKDTVLEAKGNSDVSEAEQTYRDIELPTDIEGKKDETLDTTVKNDKDIEVEKKIDAEESLESETGTKREELTDKNAEITEESKELLETESTEKIDIDAAEDEDFLTKEAKEPVAAQSSKQNNIDTEETRSEHKDTQVPTSEAEQNINTKDPIKTEEENNSTETSATDVENEEKKEDAVVNEESTMPEVKKIKEETFSVLPTTQDLDDVSKVEQASREIQLPADLESKKDETLAATEKYVDIEKNVDVEEPQESKTGTIEEEEKISEFVEPQRDQQKEVEDAPIEESDDVKTTEEAPKEEEAAPVKQKQSNNLLSKMKQSLVKAKKAIIKKAPSKTPPAS